VLARFATSWHGIVKRRRGADALLDAIEQLQGAPIPASILETQILAARIDGYDPADLDAVMAAGEVVWVGVESLGERDGRVALYLSDHLPRLLAPEQVRLKPNATPERVRLKPDATTATTATERGVRLQPDLSDRESAILDYLQRHGASFFAQVHEAVGGGFPAETVDALWSLVWRGAITNDTFRALRAFTRARPSRRDPLPRRPTTAAFRSRRLVPPSAEGRWAIVRAAPAPRAVQASGGDDRSAKRLTLRDSARTSETTKWAAAVTQQLLARHGVVTREALNVESIPGGFGIVYPVLKGLEDAGRIRRGYFVAGLGATQFAMPGALDLLRSLRNEPEETEIAIMAATDPANPYGAALKWPERTQPQNSQRAPKSIGPAASGTAASASSNAGRGPTRTVGSIVILVNGAAAAYVGRGDRQVVTFLPDVEPARSKVARAVAQVLMARARSGGNGPRGMLLEDIDGQPAGEHPLAAFLTEVGFIRTAMGVQAVTSRLSPLASRPSSSPRRDSVISSPFARRYFDDAESSDTEDAKSSEADES
jgi:ATP-dependent Lhr-like helicase